MIHWVHDFVTLMVLVDPIGTVPLFISLTAHMSDASRKRIALKAILVAAAVLFFFLVIGEIIFNAIGITLPAFRISGGIVLFLFGLKMIFDRPEGANERKTEDHDVAVFPLAVPSIATPGAILGVVVLTSNAEHSFSDQLVTGGILLSVLLICYLLIRISGGIVRLIGRMGANVLSRTMGMVVTALATELVVVDITEIVKSSH